MRHHPTARVAPLLAGLILGTAALAGAQQVTRPVPTTAMARAARVAEATAINSSPVYVAYDCRGPDYTPVATIYSLADTSVLAAGLCVVGPLQPQNPDPINFYIATGCTKAPSSKCSFAPDFRVAVPRDQVADIRLVLHLKNGDSLGTTLNPDSTEAVILSVPAYDKLILPYNLQTLGLARATMLRDQFYRRFSEAAHRWGGAH